MLMYAHRCALVTQAAGLACASQLSPPISLELRVTDTQLLQLADLDDCRDMMRESKITCKPVYGVAEAQFVARVRALALAVPSFSRSGQAPAEPS